MGSPAFPSLNQILMKNLHEKFPFLNLDQDRILTRKELKSILGGMEGDECSSTNPCANNLCCSGYGYCGSDSDSCGDGCISGSCGSPCEQTCTNLGFVCINSLTGLDGFCTVVQCQGIESYVKSCEPN
jgi:hypothetical protein